MVIMGDRIGEAGERKELDCGKHLSGKGSMWLDTLRLQKVHSRE